MDTVTTYPTGLGPVNTMLLPVRGQWLTRKKDWLPHEQAFVAADLYCGSKCLVEPTLEQTRSLSGAGSVTAVWWALRRQEFRKEILGGALPLVPRTAARPLPRQNGNMSNGNGSNGHRRLSDAELLSEIRAAGIDLTLRLATQAEATA